MGFFLVDIVDILFLGLPGFIPASWVNSILVSSGDQWFVGQVSLLFPSFWADQ